jgi:hypothetical protein
MKAQTFANVWDALEDSPEDAATMTMRSNVMAIINATIRGWNTTQAQAARSPRHYATSSHLGCKDSHVARQSGPFARRTAAPTGIFGILRRAIF